MTIEDIAKELGVSKSTVSRALSGKGRIGEETRKKIQSYARSQGARQTHIPRRRKTGNIGVVLPTDAYVMSIPFFQECLLGISEEASAMAYQVMITAGSVHDISCIRSLTEGKKTDGIILLQSTENDSRLKYLTGLSFPAALIGTCGSPNIIQADCDSREAAETLTSRLISRGYRRPVMVASGSTYGAHTDRCKGFRSAIEKHGLSAERRILYAGLPDNSVPDGIISEIFTRKADCVICADDVICTRLMSRLQSEGYRIPMDISIASLCNSTNLDCFSPAVTAVDIFPKELGKTACRQLISFLQGREYCAKTILDYEILFRKSTGKPD